MSLCLLRRLPRGPCDTVLKYERTIMCTLVYNSKWHQDMPGQAHSEEFGEGMLYLLGVLQPEEEPPRVARSRQKEREKNRTSRKNQTKTMATRRKKMRI